MYNIHYKRKIVGVKFEWDEAKNTINKQKHGLSFETATRAFADPLAVFIQDLTGYDEERWQLFGMIDGFVLLLVVHTVRGESEDIIRIISARKATRKERQYYENEIQ
jgi:uncharacterized protein